MRWPSSTWMPVLVWVLTTMLLTQIATAQGPGSTTVTVSPLPMVNVVQPGTAPAGQADAISHIDAPVLGAPTSTSAGLVIVPTFDVSITSDPNAAAIEAAINTAIATIESQFSDPITVNITFQKGGGLGSSSSFGASLPYAMFLAALKSDAKTSDDATAVGQLANVAANPVNGATTIVVKSANLKALGFSINSPSDGTISVNTAITSPGSPGSTGAYNLIPVVLHEIDEILGLGSSLPSIVNGTILPEDLYRYSSVNTRTFTTVDSRSSGVLAYFSIDAQTALAEFNNQNDGGDFGDWQSNPLRPGVPRKVQDESGFPGANPTMSIELTALDVIGYDRVPSVVTANSVTPNAGTGATQAFALTYGDTAGAAVLRQVWVWFNPTFAGSGAHSCMAYYQPGTSMLKLLDDAGTTWLSAPLGSGTLQNSQCAIALGSSTAVPNGNTLTLTLAVTFTPAFAGTQSVFMYATNGAQASGWQTRGTWTVPSGAGTPVVTADSVTPNAGTGATQSFALAYGDTAGPSNLQQLWVWFNPTFSSAVHSCMAYYEPATSTLKLLDDAGATWLSGSLAIGGTLQNSQCAIALGLSTVVPNGNTLTLTLAVTFRPAFAGTQTIFMYATNGLQTSSWQTRGTWTVSAPAAPVVTADTVTPNAGTGATQAFALVYGDTAGATNLQQSWVWFSPTFGSAAHSCMAYYQPGTNTLKLLDDAGATWLSAPLGSGTLQNSQCAIALGSSTAVLNGNTLTLTLAVTFTPAFAGTQTVFMYATNGAQASGWQTRGTWTAPAGSVPVVTADTVTPNAGTGATQAFALVYGDTAGATNLQQTWVWFNPTFSSAAHSCMAYYQPGTNTLKLLDDAGATWLSAPLGSGTLQNSQCAIALGSSTAVPSGNTLTLTLAVTFTPAFAGTQSVFMYATNGAQASGWQTRGTWTVPAGSVPVVTADTVTPNAGTGATQAFALVYGDTAGATNLQQTWVWFNPTFANSAAHSCMAYYQPGTNTLNLIDDSGATWLSASLGSGGTLQNSQCAIALGSSTAVPSGNVLTLTLAVTFTPGFAGTQSVFIYATNGVQASGWQTRGTWTVPSTEPTLLRYDVAPDVPTADLADIKAGILDAQRFLDSQLGGDIPVNQKVGITVKVVATGVGNQDPGGGGACCTAMDESGARPFFDVRHPNWVNQFAQRWTVDTGKKKSAAHEYTHAWAWSLGGISIHTQPLGDWLNEGIAEFGAYSSEANAGNLQMSDADAFELSSAIVTGEASRCLSFLENSNQSGAGLWPGHIGYVALKSLIARSPYGTFAVRRLNTDIGGGMTFAQAFLDAFGVSKQEFYDSFPS